VPRRTSSDTLLASRVSPKTRASPWPAKPSPNSTTTSAGRQPPMDPNWSSISITPATSMATISAAARVRAARWAGRRAVARTEAAASRR
jgi:hypothetical protein